MFHKSQTHLIAEVKTNALYYSGLPRDEGLEFDSRLKQRTFFTITMRLIFKPSILGDPF
jgi:hypothetical protein